MGDDPVHIKRGDVMGHCSLIYQDSMDDYLNEMGLMNREATVDRNRMEGP